MISPFVRRRHLLRTAGLVAMTASTSKLLALVRTERSTINLAVGGRGATYSLPLTVAEQLGYFKAEGLEVKVRDYEGGAWALQAALRGEADVVSGAYEHTIHLQNQGKYFLSFVLHGRAPQLVLGVSMRQLPHFRQLIELRGKRIGVSAPGSSTNMLVSLLLSRSGIKSDEVSFVGVGTGAGAIDTLRSGRIDALCNVDPLMSLLEQSGDVKIIADTRSLSRTQEIFGGEMPAGCLYAPVSYIQNNPEKVQAMANAIVRGLKWLQTAQPTDLIKIVPPAYWLGNRTLYLAAFNRIHEVLSLDGVLPDEGAANALKVLANFASNLDPAQIDLRKTYTNTFALRAKEKFNA